MTLKLIGATGAALKPQGVPASGPDAGNKAGYARKQKTTPVDILVEKPAATEPKGPDGSSVEEIWRSARARGQGLLRAESFSVHFGADGIGKVDMSLLL